MYTKMFCVYIVNRVLLFRGENLASQVIANILRRTLEKLFKFPLIIVMADLSLLSGSVCQTVMEKVE